MLKSVQHSRQQTVRAYCTNKYTAIEGIMYTKNTAVIMTGTFVDNYEPDKLNRMGLWFKPWFYKHVETFLKKGQRVEYIPTVDFLFR